MRHVCRRCGLPQKIAPSRARKYDWICSRCSDKEKRARNPKRFVARKRAASNRYYKKIKQIPERVEKLRQHSRKYSRSEKGKDRKREWLARNRQWTRAYNRKWAREHPKSLKAKAKDAERCRLRWKTNPWFREHKKYYKMSRRRRLKYLESPNFFRPGEFV